MKKEVIAKASCSQPAQQQGRYRRLPCQYTVEELKEVVAQAETEVDIDSEELHAYFKEKYRSLSWHCGTRGAIPDN